MTFIPYQDNIFELFKASFDKDASYVHDWIVSWEYQERRKKRNVEYGEDLPEEFYTYESPENLIQWLNWILNVKKSNFISNSSFIKWTELSFDLDSKVFDKIGYETKKERYIKGLGEYNAQDYFFANLIPYPDENRPLRVLDFGAGFGRQSNLWTQLSKDVVYIGMDAIPKSYCLQHYYYSETGKLQQEYVMDPESFSLVDSKPGIHHLPTWRWDLIPDGYLDKILLVQVMQEMNAKLVREMMKTFHRILKPGGCIYIRDNESNFRPAHRLNTNELLNKNGFTLEYRAHLQHKKDLHGIPRIWRKTNEEVVESQEISFQQRRKEWMMDLDVITQGKLKKLIKRK